MSKCSSNSGHVIFLEIETQLDDGYHLEACDSNWRPARGQLTRSPTFAVCNHRSRAPTTTLLPLKTQADANLQI
jgi:hypothetical protein